RRSTHMDGLNAKVFELDWEAETARIAARLREATARVLHKRGLVVAISGGVDSAVCAALAVRALGPDKVFTLILPERDSASSSARNAHVLAAHLGVRTEVVDIAPALAAIGCYAARDEAVRRLLCGRHQSLHADRRVAPRRAPRMRAAAARIPADRRRHQLQAAPAQDAG